MKIRPYHFLHTRNLGIGISYFTIGLVTGFISTPLSIYLIQGLNASPEIQNIIFILQTFPWALKIFFGFISDSFPILGMHRIPYLVLGACFYSLSFISYGVIRQDNIVLLSGCIFLGTSGLILMDVIVDTLCVERSRFEPNHRRGNFQSSCYATRFGGTLVGEILGASVSSNFGYYRRLSFFSIMILSGFVPIALIFPFLFK